mmetsp:Transcript_914/g.1357  ORF Transcript_914/g.1357 Transcript_914/m.1357 type:complete len:263 (+) Transcript_914:49-837(+)
MQTMEGHTVGLVGVGTIGRAVVRGLLRACPGARVVVSPRNEEKAKLLAEEFPEAVTIAKSNQEVVDACDTVMLGIHHKIMPQVVAELKFKPEMAIICLFVGSHTAATDAITAQGGKLERIVRATTLPACAKHAGTTLLHPTNIEEANYLFGLLGAVIPVEDPAQLSRLSAITCVMGDLYRRMEVAQGWLVEGGVDKRTATSFVGNVFMTMITDARDESNEDDGAFRKLVEEQTPGGLNEKVIGEQEKAGSYEIYRNSLQGLL